MSFPNINPNYNPYSSTSSPILDQLLEDIIVQLSKMSPNEEGQNTNSECFTSPISQDSPLQMYQDEQKTLRNSLLGSGDDLISAYLDPSGWTSKPSLTVGKNFARFLLVDAFCRYYTVFDPSNFEIIRKALLAFPGTASTLNNRPMFSRCKLAMDVKGWNEHILLRLTGNIGSRFHSEKPFFEIIADAQQKSPYSVSIFTNEEALDARHDELISLSDQTETKARPIYFNDQRITAEGFLTTYPDKIGPNGKRILNALKHLENVQIKEEKSENSWLKGPLRSLLAIFFIEIVSNKPEFSIEVCWTKAKQIYASIQYASAIPLMNQSIVTSPHHELLTAYDSLQNKKSLLKKTALSQIIF